MYLQLRMKTIFCCNFGNVQKQRFFCRELANMRQQKELKAFFAFAQSLQTSATLVASIAIILTTIFCQNESYWVLYCSRSLVSVLEACLPKVGAHAHV